MQCHTAQVESESAQGQGVFQFLYGYANKDKHRAPSLQVPGGLNILFVFCISCLLFHPATD